MKMLEQGKAKLEKLVVASGMCRIPFIPKSPSKQYFLSSSYFSSLVITYAIPPPSGIKGNVLTDTLREYFKFTEKHF